MNGNLSRDYVTYLMVFFRLFVEFKLSSQIVLSIERQWITYLLAQACLFLFALDDWSLKCEAELIELVKSNILKLR